MLRNYSVLYLAYVKDGHRLKVGVTYNIKTRLRELYLRYGELVLIGYKIFKSRKKAFENEGTFLARAGRRGGRLEIFPYSKEVIDKFRALNGSHCNEFMDFKELILIQEEPKMKSTLKNKMAKWREKVGYHIALQRLIDHGLSKSVGQKLLAGTYRSNPKGLYLRALEEAMK